MIEMAFIPYSVNQVLFISFFQAMLMSLLIHKHGLLGKAMCCNLAMSIGIMVMVLVTLTIVDLATPLIVGIILIMNFLNYENKYVNALFMSAVIVTAYVVYL